MNLKSVFPQNRSENLDIFIQSGVVDSLEHLNRMDQKEYENLLEILNNPSDDVAPGFSENDLNFDDDFIVPQMPLETRIKKMITIQKNRVPATDFIEEGRCKFEDFLLWYEATEKSQIGIPFQANL